MLCEHGDHLELSFSSCFSFFLFWVFDVGVDVVLYLEGEILRDPVVKLFVMAKDFFLLQFLGLLDREDVLLERRSGFAQVAQTSEDCSVDKRQTFSALHEQGLSYGSKQLRGLSLDILCPVRKLQRQALVEAQVENLCVEIVLFLEVSELQLQDLHQELTLDQGGACLGSDKSCKVV